MADREKVISGLQRCRLMNKLNCDKCPYDYNGRGNGKSECTAELAEDALELLKEQNVAYQGAVELLRQKTILFDDAIKRLNKQEWIPVAERLPEVRHAVLCYSPHHKNIWALSLHEDGEWYYWIPMYEKYNPDFEGPITHWMTLPEPPQEGR